MSGRVSPAGASPVRVGARTPGSRPQAQGEIPAVRAGQRKPVRRSDARSGEQARGPQHQVKPAASTDEQCERRVEHFATKATPSAPASGGRRAEGLAGVWGAAREHGEARNRRDPSAQPSSGQGRAYKPKAKSRAVQRESEGIVVPPREALAARTNAVKNNAAGGKGPCFGHARSEGKREGMAARSGPNHPHAHMCEVQVRQPQRGLWVGAKRCPIRQQGVEQRARGDARRRTLCCRDRFVAQAPPRRPSASRVREIRTHGLKGGSALSPGFNNLLRKGRVYQ